MKIGELLGETLTNNKDVPDFFRDLMLKDLTELEGQLNRFKMLYGLDIELEVKPIEPENGRWLGKGVVEQVSSLAEIWKKN